MTDMNDLPYFNDEHHQVRELVRDFAEAEIRPVAGELDREHRFHWENVKKMGELGFLGIPWDPELGGTGMDDISYMIAVEELARVDASHSITCSAHITLGTSPIVEFGTEEQKNKYVPLLASGQVLGGLGITEPSAGSDVVGLQTFAEDKGDHYLVNGTKNFITNGGVGEVMVITARTDKNPEKRSRGITAFVVTKDTTDLAIAEEIGIGHSPDLEKTPGFRSGKEESKMGWRSSNTTELIFEDAIVPKENMLGELGGGVTVAFKTLDAGRIGVAALALGLAQGAYEESAKYTSERKQFGKPISAFQATRFALADMATEIQAARHLVYHSAWLKQNGKDYAVFSAMAKLYASEVCMRVTTKAVQLHGGYGYTTDYPVERMMRDAKINEIGEGTSEIQRLVISRDVLSRFA
jgi:butyryl-CoA dehydrogenase